METFEKIRGLVLETIDLQDDELETKIEKVVTSSGVAMQSAQMIDTVKGEEDPTDQIDGLVQLAKVVGKTNLSMADFDDLKLSIAKIIKNPVNPQLESALEGAFFSILDLHVAIKDLNDFLVPTTQDGE